MDQREQPPADTLRELIEGYRVSDAIQAAVALGVPDLLGSGARSAGDLATAAGADADALYRLLRALAAAGVLREHEGRRFALTPVGDGLRRDAPGSLAAWSAFVGRPAHRASWAALADGVRTGQNAFRLVHGTDVWEYRAARPEEGAAFDAAMTALSRAMTRALIEAVDLGRFGVVVDVGGGQGAFLGAVLSAHPHIRGVLFDQPGVVAGAPQVLAAAGVADRCRVEGGSFFESVPGGGDAYVLRRVVHDWEDAEAVAILGVVRQALAPPARVLLVERDLGRPNEDLAAKSSDLNMLVGPGGRERSVDEYAALFDAAGLRLDAVVATAAGEHVLEGVLA